MSTLMKFSLSKYFLEENAVSQLNALIIFLLGTFKKFSVLLPIFFFISLNLLLLSQVFAFKTLQ
jgi:hypothetical protein